jgi:hypothetical protein
VLSVIMFLPSQIAAALNVGSTTTVSYVKAELPQGVGYMNGVSCLTASHCYAAGQTTGVNQSGLILKLVNGTWQKTTIPEVEYLTSVSCTQGNLCAATGVTEEDGAPTGVILTTSDGATWNEPELPKVSQGTPSPLNSVSCSGSFCMAVGTSFSNGGSVAETQVWVSKGPNNWETVSPPTVSGAPAELLAVSCDAPSDCWVVGGGVWHTNDGGQTWTEHDPPESKLVGLVEWSALTSVQFSDSEDGEVAGGDQCGGDTNHCSGAIYRTSNGGTSWKLVSSSSTPFIDNFSCGPQNAGPCAASSTTFTPTSTNGATNKTDGATILGSSSDVDWQTVQKVSGPNFPGVSCPAAGSCVLVGGVQLSNVGAIYVEHEIVVANRLGTGRNYCARAYPRRGYHFGPSVAHVYACGPTPLSGGDSGPALPPFWPTDDLGGFQCTELAIRYLYDVSGALINLNDDSQTHWNGTGRDFASKIGDYLNVPVTTHRDGHTSALPKVGDILSEMVSRNESGNEANDTATTYGDVGVVKSVSGSSIELMVQNNDGTGLNSITIQSPRHWSINGQDSGYYYTSFAWFTPPSPIPPVPAVTMPTSPYEFEVTNTATANEYSSPSDTSTSEDLLPSGNVIYVACQKAGSSVQGSSVWDKLTNGGWVSDAYTTTQNFDTFSYPVPSCIDPASVNFKIVNQATVTERSGPSNGVSSVGVESLSDIVGVVCQTKGSDVGGSDIWDYLANRSYVPDVYVSTPHAGSFDTTLPRCPDVNEFISKAK